MRTYLRFTQLEFRAIATVCHTLDLSDSFFPDFKNFLVRILADAFPDLAGRVARFRKYQLGILYQGLQERWQDEGDATLTSADYEAIARVSASCVPHPRFLSSFRDFLVRHLRQDAPGLARKLARFSSLQLARLYEQVQHRRRDS